MDRLSPNTRYSQSRLALICKNKPPTLMPQVSHTSNTLDPMRLSAVPRVGPQYNLVSPQLQNLLFLFFFLFFTTSTARVLYLPPLLHPFSSLLFSSPGLFPFSCPSCLSIIQTQRRTFITWRVAPATTPSPAPPTASGMMPPKPPGIHALSTASGAILVKLPPGSLRVL